VGAIDEYDTDGDEIDDDLSELQSIWTEKTPVMASIPLKKSLQSHLQLLVLNFFLLILPK
jgi:hypothetical protein